jgi:hypothetical protein
MEGNLKDIFEASYENPKEAKSRLENIGFTYDSDLSSPDTKIFYDKQGNPHITFRGTHRAEDVITDLKVGLGYDTKRHKEAREITKKVQEKYNKPVSAYGTSLGGHLAEKSGAQNVYTYNKATGIKDIFKTIPKTQKDYRTEKDVVSFPSLFQRGGQKITIESPTNQDILNAHSIKAFNIDKVLLKPQKYPKWRFFY